ncbi:MAG: hypothetical protein RIS64_1606 [Bacteroidota bacterium]|jgi:hypothetical protein
MNSFQKRNNIVGWLVFAITMTVFFFSVERTGSLWDCGEFVSGCYKLQVVHPPGAPLFLLIGRIFTMLGKMFSKNPAAIAFAVNLLSGACTALTGMFVCWITIILGKIALVGRENEPDSSQFNALAGAGIVSGLCTAFATSIWFSAVEGEVYAMSTCFTALTLWAMIKWYNAPDSPQSDRWMLLAVYTAALSTGVHLLSLLTFPALALFYYFKKWEKPTFLGMAGAGIAGVMSIWALQTFVITGIPKLWAFLEIICVNWFGLPFNIPSLILTLAIVGAVLYYGLKFAHEKANSTIQNILVGFALSVIGFSTIGMVVIRANANPPINMNNPSDPTRLLPYINREQYGERPLLYGPQFNKKPEQSTSEDRYGRVGNEYKVVDHKADYVFNPEDKVLFPRMGHWESDREPYYKYWMGLGQREALPHDRPDFGDNLSYFFGYQVNWMYWRYFFWNFSGRQNGEQGFMPTDNKGNWISGIPFLDQMRGLPSEKDMPEATKQDAGRNKYYMLPFIFGLFGLFWHYKRRPNDMLGLLAMFIITGIGIIVYTNEPPNEPRERDYVIVGSLFTFAIWIGMGVLAIYDFLRTKMPSSVSSLVASGAVLVAPILMGTQNFDDHSRRHHTGARDYALNFLESCEKNAVIFTYGDNDTYPLWYAQEVENIRPDIRVVNLSLIQIDWYIDQARRKVNTSPTIKLTIPSAAIRGDKRQQIPLNDGGEMSLLDWLKYVGEDHPVSYGQNKIESVGPSKKLFIPIDRNKMIANGLISATDSVVDKISFTLNGNFIGRDDIAVLDIIGSNINERPIYFAVTCRPEKMQGMDAYMQLEGLASRIIPVLSAKEDPMLRGLGIIASGRVAEDKILEKVTKKFKWGNFDKRKAFIDRSYRPSVQTTQYVIMRTVSDMLKKGKKEQAIQLLDKFFEAFPNMNFPYDGQILTFIQMYIEAGAFDKAGKHGEILAKSLAENLHFYASMTPSIKQNGYNQEEMMDKRTKDDLINLARSTKNTDLIAKLEVILKPYGLPPSAPDVPLNPAKQ